MERVLGGAVKRQTWTDLRLDTECRTEEGLRSATIYGSGAGVWNRAQQLAMTRQDVLALLRAIEAAGFPRMPETYGEDVDEVELTCRVRLDLDGATKQVHQLSTGPQSPALKRLAERILERAEEAGRAGPGASSLTAGLEKIAGGELAPELLTIHVLRQAEGPGSPQGWDLTLEGGKLAVQSFPAPEEKPRTVRLAPAEVARIAGQLAAARLEELPGNLWAPEYTDFEIRVLNRRRSFQARQFAGMTPATHGEQQQRFDRLWEVIAGLRGRPSAPSP